MIIERHNGDDFSEIMEVWETSVRSTHHFLQEEDILFYKELLKNEYLYQVELYVIRDKQKRIAAFTGLGKDTIEMLFVRPDAQGKGYGSVLLDFAVCEKQLRKVDVNEQNENACRFYINKGFSVVSREETDATGRPFPILHLSLPPDDKRMEDIHISLIQENKKDFLSLLLLADEQENMIDRYLDGGEMYVMFKGREAVCVCVVMDEGDGLYEVKNLAVAPSFQRKGYGARMLNFVSQQCQGRCRFLQVGTGETPQTLNFYQYCGFVYSHRIPDFFTENYAHPIIEDGLLLKDMIYLRKAI